MLKAALIVLGCQLAGETLARATGLPLPGAVLGMGLLLLLIALRPATVGEIRVAATALLRLLPLLFVPAGVGVIAQAPALKGDAGPLIVAFVVSTILAVLVAAIVFTWVARAVAPAQEGSGHE